MMKGEGSSIRPPATTGVANPLSRTLFAIFGGNQQASSAKFDKEGAKKVNPKLFFANERTFLKWMNVSMWVAGISIGLSSISSSAGSNGNIDALSSLLFLGISIVICCYSMFQCKFLL
jgi:hypothetical protein